MNDYNNYVYSQRWNVCNTTTPRTLGYLDLKRAQGAFWILLGGLALAAVLLFAELGIRWLVVQVKMPELLCRASSDWKLVVPVTYN